MTRAQRHPRGRLGVLKASRCAILLGSTLICGHAAAGVAETRLTPTELGGVTRILRYAVAQPDRSEAAYLFLVPSRAPEGLPEQVQVVGQGGAAIRLADTQGADCTLEHVWIRKAGREGPEVVYAARVFGGDLKADVASEPAPMDVSVFRPQRGEQPGDSAVVLRLVGAPTRSRAVCTADDVQREMVRLSATSRGSR